MESEEWFSRRERFFKNPENQHCWICKKSGGIDSFHAHHLTYETLGHESDYHLAALCPPCHRAVHLLCKRHPELTVFGATYVIRQVFRGWRLEKALENWGLRRRRIAKKHRIDEGGGDVVLDELPSPTYSEVLALHPRRDMSLAQE